MQPVVLNGREVAKEIESGLVERINSLFEKHNKKPVLATILVGQDEASVTYIKMKKRACERVGIEFRDYLIEESVTTSELIALIETLNSDSDVNGILIQHPLPAHVDEQLCFDTISVCKDVDGVSSVSFGKMVNKQQAFVSATPLGIVKLLQYYNIEIEGKHAVIVGRSAILGKPVAMQLLNLNATVTICHSKTKNLDKILKTADIVVGAVGKPEFIKEEWLKNGVVLVDAGYNKGNIGDIDINKSSYKSFAYTPVPGGVGPMTIAMLLTQTVDSFEKRVSC